MRLLDVDTYQFVVTLDPRQQTREGESTGRYAILSHTWEAQDQELSYQDWNVWLQEGPGYQEIQTRSGFRKIKDACHIANLMRYDRIWIDTIRIDKSSSAELSEAINSMFVFYKYASTCLTYLSDVNVADGDEGFMRSRWFTRVWTLQELLAPLYVQFYDGNWKSLGTKQELEDRSLLSRATGIPGKYVWRNRLLRLASVAERMSWASKRETTRIEDTAYCLLGIFDINMPLLYGEADKAFLRLQEEILKVSTDQTIFAWSWPHELPSTLPVKSWVTFLAPNARCFADTGSTYAPIALKSYEEVVGSIHLMTNLGLQMSLPLIHTFSNRAYAPLKVRRLDNSSTQEVVCIPIVIISGVYIRCQWPENPVVIPEHLLRLHLRHHYSTFLGRIGSPGPKSLLYPQAWGLLNFPTPQLYTVAKVPLQSALHIMFCEPGSYDLLKIAHTKGVTFVKEHSMLGIWHDQDIEGLSSLQDEETFKGAVIFLRPTRQQITRIVQVILGVRQTGTGPRQTRRFHLSISRMSTTERVEVTLSEADYICRNIQGKIPHVDLVQKLSAPGSSNSEVPNAGGPGTMVAPNILAHARDHIYNAAIGAPINAEVQTDVPSPPIKPYPAFVWQELE